MGDKDRNIATATHNRAEPAREILLLFSSCSHTGDSVANVLIVNVSYLYPINILSNNLTNFI